MTTNVQRWDHTPPQPPVDEGYWAALLKEGEFSEAAPAASDVSIQEDRHYIDETAEAFHSRTNHVITISSPTGKRCGGS